MSQRAESIHFGQLLRARGLISSDHLGAALAEQERSPYLRIGEILLGMGFLTFPQLKGTLEDQYHDVRLGQRLLDAGLVTTEQLSRALEVQERTGARLGSVLLDEGVCTERQLYRLLAELTPATGP